MNHDNEQRTGSDIDSQVSNQYGALAGEKAPAHLDRAVMREANRAMRADNRKGSFGAWFRPVAFMTMIGLTLAIILDLGGAGIFRPAPDQTFETAPLIVAPPDSASDADTRDSSQSALTEIKRQEKLAPPPSVDADDVVSNVAASGTPQEASTEVRQANRSQPQKLRRAVSQPDTATQFAAPQAASARESDLLSGPAACSEQQKSDAGEWWQCIQSLRQAGLAEAADLELENLRKNFPDFEPPQ